MVQCQCPTVRVCVGRLCRVECKRFSVCRPSQGSVRVGPTVPAVPPNEVATILATVDSAIVASTRRLLASVDAGPSVVTDRLQVASIVWSSPATTTPTSYCLGMRIKSHRPFRKWYARTTKRSTLQDFVRLDGKWPTEDHFAIEINHLLGRHALGEFDTYVELLPLRPKVARLYSDVTAIVQQVVPSADLATFEFQLSTSITIAVPRLGVEIGSKTAYFPNIPPKGLREVTRTIPKSRKPHPVVQFIDTVPEHVAFDHLEFFFDCRRYILPTVHDVMLRLLYRGLPIRSKFWFLQGDHPDIVSCEAPGCNGVETEEHLLFRCSRVQTVWGVLLPLWRQLTRQPIGWRDVVLGLRVDRVQGSSSEVECVKIVWTVLCSVILHRVWGTRNRWVFKGRALPPSHALVKVVLSVFASHLRFIELVWRTSEDRFQALKWFRHRMVGEEPTIPQFFTKNTP